MSGVCNCNRVCVCVCVCALHKLQKKNDVDAVLSDQKRTDLSGLLESVTRCVPAATMISE